MTWRLNRQEFAAVLKLPGDRRYKYFIGKVADQGEIWSLWHDGWALSSDDTSREAIPVWPHANFASACANLEWARFIPRSIVLEEWLEKWVPGATRDGRTIAVFPTPHDKAVFLQPSLVKADLEKEMRRFV
jgi:hypothetical protein